MLTKNINIITLFIFFFLSYSLFSQNSRDTVTLLNFKNSKLIFINISSEDEWDFEAEEREDSEKNSSLSISSEILLGMNSYTSSVNSLSLPSDQKNMDINYKRARCFNYSTMLKGIDLFSKRVYLAPGIGISWNNYFFKHPIQISANNDTTEFILDTITDISKYKLKVTYLELPIIIGTRFGNLNKKTFGLHVGVIGSYKIGSQVVKKYSEDGIVYKTKIVDHFNLNNIKVSGIAKLTIGIFGIYIRYSITPLFIKDKAYMVYPFSAGLIFGNF